ncbi:MAG: hypothetical protein IJX26_04350, partial [Clostridia bacterium]|nr:hypothetical protein [Clostridia bacterium]
YVALFLDDESCNKLLKLEQVRLPKQINNLHCTLCFNPSNTKSFDNFLGKNFELKVVGYGCNGRNSGFEVELCEKAQNLYSNKDEFGNLKTPHITTSLKFDAKAVDTSNMFFQPLENPIKLTAKLGYFVRNKANCHICYESFNEKTL